MVLKVAGKSWKTCQWETMDNHCIIGDLLGTIVLEAGKRWEQHLGYTNPLDVGDFCCGTGSYQHGDKSLCDPFFGVTMINLDLNMVAGPTCCIMF